MTTRIEVDAELGSHPKTIQLLSITGLQRWSALGKLQEFWSWCALHAEDGDLRNGLLESVCKLLHIDPQALIKAGFVEEKPYTRVRNWWKYRRVYLLNKYQRYPERWQKIRDAYRKKTDFLTESNTENLSESNFTVEAENARTKIEDVKDFNDVDVKDVNDVNDVDVNGFKRQRLATSQNFLQKTTEKKPYRVPLPEKDPTSCLVLAYKVLKGQAYDDRDWDAIHFGRCKTAATKLLKACGDFQTSLRCLEELGKYFDRDDMAWTFETVVRHAHDWKNKTKGKSHGRTLDSSRLSKAVADERANGSAARAGDFATAREVLDGGRSLPTLPTRSRGQVTSGDRRDD